MEELFLPGKSEAAAINQIETIDAARLCMVSSIVTGYFRDTHRAPGRDETKLLT